MRVKKYAKRLVVDAVGYTLLVLALTLGWLPGPGGVPLLLAGLALLSIYNPWASRFRAYAIEHVNSLLDVFFPNNKLVMWLWDAASVAALTLAVFVYRGTDGLIKMILPTLCITGFLVAVAKNRRRLESAIENIKKISKANKR
ncbi:hypothetical protein KC878_01560 [Candidatus Saccharibacteria bacterium]|nr:hypothetical protein [Candidatus Saccharibacteria bacterium]